jgi:hypothetical protein
VRFLFEFGEHRLADDRAADGVDIVVRRPLRSQSPATPL